MLQRVLLTTLLGLALLGSHRATESAPRPIQQQGSSPYCLFAVNAYLARGDMWQLEAEYHRRRLPTWDGLIPLNGEVMKLASELYAARWKVLPHGGWSAAREAVMRGYPTAFSGQGHAIVVIGIYQGRVTYLDSLNAAGPQHMSEEQLRSWWDGWAWYNEHL